MKTVAVVCLGLLLLLETAGCAKPKAAPPRPPRTPPELSYTFRGGPERRVYDAPFSRVWDAALLALDRLKIQIRRTSPALGQIEARDPAGNPVILELSPRGDQTYVEVQTLSGQERTASDVNRVLSDLLANPPSPPGR